ncbi:MAG: peptidoglycan-binding protein [Blastocatellia bacterium]|nr:peptidoglycan-binding protein [Blastocatellia bacterium]
MKNTNYAVSVIKSFAASLALAVCLLGFATQVQAAQNPGPAPKPASVATPRERKANPNTQYGKVQQRLKEMGLYKGDITGFKNQETTDALTAFQKQNNLKVTGTLSKETKDKLGIVAATKAAKPNATT